MNISKKILSKKNIEDVTSETYPPFSDQNIDPPGIEEDMATHPKIIPGPVWTPLNPAERKFESIQKFGEDTLFKRPAQPAEIAPAYVYLASHITGGFVTGETINIFGSASGAN